MLVNLSDALTNQGKVVQIDVDYEASEFKSSMGVFQIVDKSPISLTISNTGKDEALIEGHVQLAFATNCDRCLTDVKTKLELEFERIVASPDVVAEDEDSRQFMEGYQINMDGLVQNEILVNWPVKILCKDDCKGICPKCGQNLNMSECGCDTFVPDPRMAVLNDIFNSNKEV